MSDAMRIDGHKLMFHPRRVAGWLDGENIFPAYVEISPTGACNHRCLFCALDYLDYEPRFLETALMRERIAEMAQLGIKSIMFGGEGEPLLHRNISELVLHTKACGIDVALTTNGVFLTETLMMQIAASVSWIKVSLNAGTAATYSRVHRTREADFEQVFANINAAASVISQSNAGCTLGVQAILLPENEGEMELLAERSRDAGAAYLVVKSYSQHQKSITRQFADLDYNLSANLAERLQRFSTDRFKVIVRLNSMQKLTKRERGYDHCLALPFWSYIDAGGTVWGCSAFLGDERFRYGSLYEESFAQIWQGERRRRSLEMVNSQLAIDECRINCRMDEINRYLWELTHPHHHVNFI